MLCLSCWILIGSIRAEDKSADAKTKKVTAGDLILEVPATWKQKDPQSQFRAAEFEIPAIEGDKESGELAVFYFQGGGGDLKSNMTRWVGQFEEDGRKIKVYSGKSKQGEYTLVDLSGTYKKSVGPPALGKSKRLPGWRVINVFLQTEKGPYFLKFDGPTKTVTAVADQYRTAFGGNAKEEKEEKLAE